MKCDDVSALLDQHAEEELTAVRSESVSMHLARCQDCACALEALVKLRSTTTWAIPEPRSNFFDQAMWIATSQPRARQRPVAWRGFFSGAGVGGALAAGIVMMVMSFGAVNPVPGTAYSTDIAIALHHTRDIMFAIDSPSEISHAEFRVVLTGAIGLTGYEGREVRWSAPLHRGVNMLTLPVILQGKSGGHLLVEVAHGEKRQTFALQLKASS
jgi:hypothetical protein